MHVKNEERTSPAASALGALNDLIKLHTCRHETFGKNVASLRESLFSCFHGGSLAKQPREGASEVSAVQPLPDNHQRLVRQV